MKRVAIVVGHTERKQGAVSPFLQVPYNSEFMYNSKVAEFLVGNQVDIYTYDASITGYTQRVKELAEEINKIDYELVIELHFNACANPDANGTEALYYYNSEKGKKYSMLFCQLFTPAFQTKNRYEKGLYSKKQRGFGFLEAIKAPAIILEPFFGSSEEDIEKVSIEKYIDFLKYFVNNFVLK